MTAVNVWISPDGGRGYLLTDSALCDGSTGIFEAPTAKAYSMPHCLSVAAGLGKKVYLHALMAVLERHISFDHMERSAPALLRKTHSDICAEYGYSDVRIVALGWSHTDSRVRACVASSEEGFAFERAVEVAEPETSGFRWDGAIQEDPGAYLLARMQFQRRYCQGVTSSYSGQFGGIGSAAVLTELGPEEIRQSVVHYWPDKLGEVIKS